MIYWFLGMAAACLFIIIIKKRKETGKPKLPVLMYHKVCEGVSTDFLTVQASVLESHFDHLQKNGFTPVLLSELTSSHLKDTPLPPKPVMITFDDGYRDNFILMYPLLKKYGMKANIFIVPSFLNNGASNNQKDSFLTLEDINSMDPALVEFGLHSYDHKSYSTLSMEELAADIRATRQQLNKMAVRFQPCLAFPYGAYPKKDKAKQKQFFNTLASNEIVLAFRIGNRLNPLPLKNPLLIQRQDIRGSMPVGEFVKKLHKSRGLIA